MPPHQFCKPGAAKAKRLNDSFPSCSCCRAPKPAKPLHRRASPPIVGDLVCATACRRACGNNTWKLKHRATRLLLIYTSGIPATSLWAVQESEKKTLKRWSGPCHGVWSLNPENFTLITPSSHLVGGAEGENPHGHLFYYRNCACSWHSLLISVADLL